MSGWGEGPGGGMLARMIGEAFARAERQEWLAKVKRPGGGESVLGWYATREEAQARVDEYNVPYQSDDAYVEAARDRSST